MSAISAKRFYGRIRNENIFIRTPPDESDDSELEDDDQDIDDPSYSPENDQDVFSGNEIDQNNDDTDPDIVAIVDEDNSVLSSKNLKQKLFWKSTTTKVSYPVPVWKAEIHSSTEIKTPYDYFTAFMDDELLNILVAQSNLYSAQTNPNKPSCISKEEIEQFIGIACFMSIYNLPRQRMYWGTPTRVRQIADVMPVNRWEVIKKNYI